MVLPRRTTLPSAFRLAFHTGRKKLIFNSTVVKDSSGPSVLANAIPIADAAMGMAFASTLGPEASFTTVDLQIHFFRPVWKANVNAEGRVVRRGSTTRYV